MMRDYKYCNIMDSFQKNVWFKVSPYLVLLALELFIEGRVTSKLLLMNSIFVKYFFFSLRLCFAS